MLQKLWFYKSNPLIGGHHLGFPNVFTGQIINLCEYSDIWKFKYKGHALSVSSKYLIWIDS